MSAPAADTASSRSRLMKSHRARRFRISPRTGAVEHDIGSRIGLPSPSCLSISRRCLHHFGACLSRRLEAIAISAGRNKYAVAVTIFSNAMHFGRHSRSYAAWSSSAPLREGTPQLQLSASSQIFSPWRYLPKSTGYEYWPSRATCRRQERVSASTTAFVIYA